jgi:hypothetical protein
MIRSIQVLAAGSIEVAPHISFHLSGRDAEILEDLKDGRLVSRPVVYRGRKHYIDFSTERRGLTSGSILKASDSLCRIVGKDVWYSLYEDDSY